MIASVTAAMGLLNWRSRSPYRIESVLVPASSVDDDGYPEELPMYVAMFIDHALRSTMYARHELPHEAIVAAHVQLYVAEVGNGGHAQFVANTGWNTSIRGDVREGLDIFGPEEAVRIFADLEAFAKNEPQRFRCIGGMGSAALANLYKPGSEPETIDPYFHELDHRFSRVAGAIDDANMAWIRTRPWLRVLPDEEYERIPGWKSPDHPLMERRRKEFYRRAGFDLNTFLARIREMFHPTKPRR